jgi:hypothetical protein
LLPIISKLLEKLILNRIKQDDDPNDWIPDHQFGFRQAHSTVQQCHRIANIINQAMENKQYCTAAFLDVSQAFDMVWHSGLLYKIRRVFPIKYFTTLQSYLTDREFEIRINAEVSNRRNIKPGVPQGSISTAN